MKGEGYDPDHLRRVFSPGRPEDWSRPVEEPKFNFSSVSMTNQAAQTYQVVNSVAVPFSKFLGTYHLKPLDQTLSTWLAAQSTLARPGARLSWTS